MVSLDIRSDPFDPSAIVDDDGSLRPKLKAKAKARLPRAERKELERARKQRLLQLQQQILSSNGKKIPKKNGPSASGMSAAASRRKHNYSQRQPVLESSPGPNEGRYDLHSTALPTLIPDTTSADDVIRAIKRAQNLHDVHDLRAIKRFIVEQASESFAYGFRGSMLARLAVAALHINATDLAEQALRARSECTSATARLPLESAAIVRGLLRTHNVTAALRLLEDELPLPLESQVENWGDARIYEQLIFRASALASVASRHFFEGEPAMAVLACHQMARVGPLLRKSKNAAASSGISSSALSQENVKLPWERLLNGAGQCESARRGGLLKSLSSSNANEARIPLPKGEQLPCNVAYSVLNAMTTFPSVENSDRLYELLANVLVRRVIFVAGAVTMEGCPVPDRGEAAFIGRSNVGKSSLVNMITNRKSLAFTSKRPGKTQQYNFFAVNDKPGREKEVKYGDIVDGERDLDSFYLVDLPGFGYAKVSDQLKEQWAALMKDYISNRSSLRVLFHLIDARHGPSTEDAAIMRLVRDCLPSFATYVVVLTKADKNVKSASTKNSGKVSRDVMNAVTDSMRENGVGHAPVILSSAETKLGRDDVWRYLRLAAEA
jgi:GTP-binding protein